MASFNCLRVINRAGRREYGLRPLTLEALINILYGAYDYYREAPDDHELFDAAGKLDLAKYQQLLFADAALGVNDTLGGTDEQNDAIRTDYNTILYAKNRAFDSLHTAYQYYISN